MANRSIGRNASSVGMMEGAFFVGRTELLDWVNSLLGVSLTKVEQCASGAIYCQVVDACHPGSVKMAKVNWMARADHEYIPNYKILQAAFDRNKIEKHIDVDKLIRAKYQDNLEFLQWMKAMWDREGTGVCDYDAVGARAGRPVPAWGNAKPLPNAAEKENVTANRDQIGADKKFAPNRRPAAAPAAAKAAAQRTPAPRPGAKPGVAPAAARPTAAAEEELKLKVADQEEEIEDLRNTLEGLERERDYYFVKLRNVEILCEHVQAKTDGSIDVDGLVQQITGILYAEGDNVDPADELPVEGQTPSMQMMDEVPDLPACTA